MQPMYGCQAALALWKLAQSRTHQSSLAAPLSRQWAEHDAPSAEYWRTLDWIEHMKAWYGFEDLWL